MRAKVYNPEVVEVSARRQVTDKNGEAVFIIKAKDKAGNAVVIFRDGSLNYLGLNEHKKYFKILLTIYNNFIILITKLRMSLIIITKGG